MINIQEIVTRNLNLSFAKHDFDVKGYMDIIMHKSRWEAEENRSKFLVVCTCTNADITEGKNILFVSSANKWGYGKTRDYHDDIVYHCMYSGTPGFRKRHLDITFEERVIEGVSFIIAFQNNLDKTMQDKIILRELRISDEIVDEHIIYERMVKVYEQNGFIKLSKADIDANLELYLPGLKEHGIRTHKFNYPDATDDITAHDYGSFDINNTVYCEEDFLVTAEYKKFVDGTQGLSVAVIYADNDVDHRPFTALYLGDVHDGKMHVMIPAGDKLVDIEIAEA